MNKYINLLGYIWSNKYASYPGWAKRKNYFGLDSFKFPKLGKRKRNKETQPSNEVQFNYPKDNEIILRKEF